MQTKITPDEIRKALIETDFVSRDPRFKDEVYINGFGMPSIQWDKWLAQYANTSHNNRLLNGALTAETSVSKLQNLVELRVIAETLVPNCTMDGISRFRLSRELITVSKEFCPAHDSDKLFELQTRSNPEAWIIQGPRDKDPALAIPFLVDTQKMESELREELKKYPNGFPEGYCIKGGLAGLQLLLACGSSELIRDCEELILESTITLNEIKFKLFKEGKLPKSDDETLRFISNYFNLFGANYNAFQSNNTTVSE